VLVAVDAASVNPVDFKIRSGKYPAVKDDRLPYTLGRDFSGIVEKCGVQATRFKPGVEVFGMVSIYGGGYSEKVVVDEWAIALKPAGMDHVHAAAIPLAGQTAWQGLFRHGGLKAGQTVLIHGGSGGVGHYAIQFAKAKGARVLTTVNICSHRVFRVLTRYRPSERSVKLAGWRREGCDRDITCSVTSDIGFLLSATAGVGGSQ
jgi:NADPH:quinone reductase-like Zn-dependent oxidoreductase